MREGGEGGKIGTVIGEGTYIQGCKDLLEHYR